MSKKAKAVTSNDSSNMKLIVILVTLLCSPIVGLIIYLVIGSRMTAADKKTCRIVFWVVLAIWVVLVILMIVLFIVFIPKASDFSSTFSQLELIKNLY